VVHFSGTIVTYRVFRDEASGPVVDEFFRILFLALLEDLVPAPDGRRVVPEVEELARGLTDPAAPVTYGSEWAVREYPTFRGAIDELSESPIFRGDRAERLRERLRPFDEHFERRMAEVGSAPPPAFKFRSHGLG
jgi:hypothetical protein